jgi:hypothetical protein
LKDKRKEILSQYVEKLKAEANIAYPRLKKINRCFSGESGKFKDFCVA